MSIVSRMKDIMAPTSQWFAAGLVVGFLIVLGVFVRQPAATMSPIEGYWTPNVQYGTWYLANNNRLFPVTGTIPRVSNYTSGLNYGAVDFVHTFLTGAALILSHTTDLAAIGTAYLWLPWQGLVLMPLAAFAMYSRWARSLARPIQPLHLVVLYIFSTFPTYQMIVWSSSAGTVVPLGWMLFFCLYLVVFAKAADSRHSWQWGALLAGSLLIMQATYHTTALVVTVMLPTLWLVQILLGKKYISLATVQLGVVVFLSFLMYYAITFWSDYGRLAAHFLKDIYRSHDDQWLQYNLQALNLHPLWYIVNYVAILLPVVWILFLAIRSYKRTDISTFILHYQLAWIIVLLPLAALFFVWNGIFGAYGRLLQYGTLLALPAVGYLLITRRNAFVPIAGAALTCLTISVTLLHLYPISSTNFITHDENEAVQWIAAHKGCDTVIFTDFRIGSTFGYKGCFDVVGPTASTLNARNQMDVLPALLYAAEPSALSHALDVIQTTDKRRADVILVSQRFLDPQTGFFMPDVRVQPMTKAQWFTYRSLPEWRIIFENNSTLVLARNDAED